MAAQKKKATKEAPPSPVNGNVLKRGPGRPKGSKTRRPLAVAEVFRKALDLAGDHIAKNGQLKASGLDVKANGALAYALKMAISEDAGERRMFQQAILKLMPTEIAAKAELSISDSLEALLAESRKIEEDIIDVSADEKRGLPNHVNLPRD